MTDDFDGYLNEALAEEPVEPAEPEAEAAPETPADDTPRDEQGRFTQKELIAGKYKSVEELEKAYEHAQRKLGEMGQRLGALENQPEPVYDFSQVDDDTYANPQLAAQHALVAKQQGDALAYERIIQSWGEYDPLGAARFDARLAAAEQMAQVQPQIQSAQQFAHQNELQSALGAVASRHEDFNQVVGSLDEDRLTEIVQGGFPTEVLAGLTGGAASKEAVFETLYRWVKAEQADTIARASSDVSASHEAETRQAKQQAAVASATSAPTAEGTGSKELDSFYEFMAQPSATNWSAG